MKTLTTLLIMAGLCSVTLFAQDTEGSAIESNGVLSIKSDGICINMDSFAESIRIIHEINKENIAAVKEETRINFEAATAPNSGLVKLNETKGFWNKIKVIFSNIIESANANTEKENLRRAEIQTHESYRTTLEEQRTNRQSATAR